MSPVHGNQGQPFGRPAAPSQNNSQWGQQPQQPQAAQPAYGGAYAPAPGQGYAPQAANAGYGQPAAQQPYGQPAYAQQPAYGAAASGYGNSDGYPQTAAPAASTGGRAPASYAPQFEPYAPPAAPAPRQQAQPQYAQPQGYPPSGYDFGTTAAPHAQSHAPQQHYPQQGYAAQPAPQAYQQPAQHAPQSWGQPQPQADSRGFDLGTYHPAQQQPGYGAQEPSLGGNQHAAHGEWGQDGYANEPQFYAQDGQQAAEYGAPGEYAQDGSGNDLGFGQPAGGELDQGYVDEEAQDYEAEAPSRFRRPLMMAAVLAGAILVGGGSMYAYKAVFGGPHAGDPPVVKSASAPTKIKPDDGGGKQFAHTDSKVMGRLGDGSSSAEGSDVDANGTRKVSTLVVGRDGSIQAPASESAAPAQPAAPVNVPGLTVVDGLGAARPPVRPASPPPPQQQQTAQLEEAPAPAPPAAPKVVNSAPQKPANVTKVNPPAEATGSIEPEADAAPVAAAPAAAPAKPKKPKVAAAPAADAGSTSVATTGSGFVAVLASVPRTNSSRMDALKRFADMQQKYGSALAGKTPDVAEANLGAKGNYHRLVVGPPGSREQASAVCSQLKSQGYADCWVTSY